MIVLGIDNGIVSMVDEKTGVDKWSVNGHPASKCTAVSVSPSGRFIISAGINGRQWKLWDCFGKLQMAYPVHDGTGDCICDGNDIFINVCPYAKTDGLLVAKFSPCGRWIAVAGLGGDLWLWDMKNKVVNIVHTFEPELSSISFSGDGNFLSCAGYESLHIVDVVNKSVTKSWENGSVSCFCPTNNNLLATADRFKLRLWNIETETEIWNISSSNNEDEYESFVVFSPDGLTIATVDQIMLNYDSPGDGDEPDEEDVSDPVHVSVVHTETGMSKFRLPHTRDAVIRDAAFSPSGDKLVTVEEIVDICGICRMWDMSNGTLLWKVDKINPIQSVSWGPSCFGDEMRLAFAMGNIARLGHGSWVLPLDQGVVKMILDHL